MSHSFSLNPDDSPLSRVLQRSSALFTARRSSLFRQTNSSALSVSTITSFLPQYSESDPQSVSSVSVHDASQGSLTNNSLPTYMEEEGDARRTVPVTPRSSFYGSSSSRLTSQQPDILTHSFPLRQMDKPWVTLHLYTPKDTYHHPTHPQVYGGKPLEGLVELDIEKPMTIQEIKLTIKGRIVMGSSVAGHHTFLSQTIPLWSKSFGDSSELNTTKPREASDAKFSGYRSFPFSLVFPTEVNRGSGPLQVPAGGVVPFPLTGHSLPSSPVSPSASTSLQEPENYHSTQRFGTLLPPSFSERGTVSTVIQYEMCLQLTHGRFRPATRITTGLIFVPTVTPPPLPLARRLAYDAANHNPSRLVGHGVMIPSPLVDPSSWFALKSATVNGFVAVVQKPITVECVLYFALPLSYTCGTVIPCFLSISGDDSGVLDTLCTPTSPLVRLVRKIRYPTQEKTEDKQLTVDGTFGLFWGSSTAPDGETRHVSAVDHLATAVWWKPPKDVEQRSFSRYLAGEIHVPRGLFPTSSCNFFNIEYFVEMVPFRAQSYVFDNVLATQIVEIASTHALEGPVPVPFTKPPRTRSHRANSASTSSAS